MLLESRTRATFRRAEFGFLGVMILTCKQTPFFWGQPCRAGCLGRLCCCTRGLRTSWLMVGIAYVFPSSPAAGPAVPFGERQRDQGRGFGGRGQEGEAVSRDAPAERFAPKRSAARRG